MCNTDNNDTKNNNHDVFDDDDNDSQQLDVDHLELRESKRVSLEYFLFTFDKELTWKSTIDVFVYFIRYHFGNFSKRNNSTMECR